MSFNSEKAKQIHNNKYDYSKVVYKNVDTKVVILCPIHNEFLQTPYHHISRSQGCPLCKGNKISLSKNMGKEQFIEKSVKIHGNRYNYEKVNYTNAHTKVTINCDKHGDFSQTPNNHIYDKNGCPSCGYNTSKTANAWLDSLNVDMLDRERVIYINNIKYKVDAYVSSTNTIYEYFGYFWHGHPDKFSHEKINPKNKVPFKTLYDITLNRIENIKSAGFNIIYCWGD